MQTIRTLLQLLGIAIHFYIFRHASNKQCRHRPGILQPIHQPPLPTALLLNSDPYAFFHAFVTAPALIDSGNTLITLVNQMHDGVPIMVQSRCIHGVVITTAALERDIQSSRNSEQRE